MEVALAERAAGRVDARGVEPAEPHRVEMLELLVREGVVDLGEVDVGRFDPGARTRLAAARSAEAARSQSRHSIEGASAFQPTPSTKTAGSPARSSVDSTRTTQPSTGSRPGRRPAGRRAGSDRRRPRTTPGGWTARARGCVTRRPRSPPPSGPSACRYRRISSPASASAETPSGRFSTGSSANRRSGPCVRTSVAFEWASTATRARRRCGSASPPSRARTARRRRPCARAAAPRRAGRARTRRRCSCPPRCPRSRDEGVDLAARVDARVLVGAAGGLEHQLLVGDALGGRGEAGPADPGDTTGAPWLHVYEGTGFYTPRVDAVATRNAPRAPYRDPVSDIVWSPTPEYVERANVTRFMRAHGIDTYDELVQRSVADIAWFWDAVVRGPRHRVPEPYEQVLDVSRGVEWATWFGGGRIEPGPPMRGPLGRGDPGRARRRVGGRGRRDAGVDLRGAPAADRPTRASAHRARGRGAATRSASSCPCSRRPWPRSWPARSSAPSGSRSSAGSAPTRSRSGSRMPVLGPPDGRRVPSEGPRRPDARRGAERRRPRGHGPRDRRPAARGRGRRSGGARLGEPGRGRVGRAPRPPSRWTASIPCSSGTRAARPADRRGSCTSTAGSS